MNIHAHAIQAARRVSTLGNGVIAARRPARQHLTICWQVRDGALGQVWRTADGIATTLRDAGETQRLAA